jgi:Tfp pilus assembly protein PilF
MKNRWSILVLLFPILALLAGTSIFSAAQSQVPAPQPVDTHTRPGSLDDLGPQRYWSELSAQERAGGALIGKLSVEGEPMLWEPVLVFVTCNGKITHVTQADPKGSFVISSTQVPGALSLQADAKRQMETRFEGCTVEGDFAGFQSTSVTITRRNLQDDPNIGIIKLTRAAGATGAAISSTTAAAPSKALKAYEKARADLETQNPDLAQHDLQKAVEIDPGFAEAWYQLGKLQQVSSSEDAKNSFTKAVAADPKYVLPYGRLAALAAKEGKWPDVVSNTDRVLQLNPVGTPQIWYYNALGNWQVGNVDAAQTSAEKSLALDPLHAIPNTEQLLAVILSKKGDYAGALQHLRNCLSYLQSGTNADFVKSQIAQLEQRAGNAK